MRHLPPANLTAAGRQLVIDFLHYLESAAPTRNWCSLKSCGGERNEG